MGIRYYARSIDLDDYQRISAGPCPTCGARPHAREPEYDQPEADSLDLDKSWGYLQRFFVASGHDAAAELVMGDVTHTSRGWISHQGTVAPSRVPDVAADLARVTTAELQQHFQPDGVWRDERSEQDFGYVHSYLAEASRFCDKVVADHRGIVYYIG